METAARRGIMRMRIRSRGRPPVRLYPSRTPRATLQSHLPAHLRGRTPQRAYIELPRISSLIHRRRRSERHQAVVRGSHKSSSSARPLARHNSRRSTMPGSTPAEPLRRSRRLTSTFTATQRESGEVRKSGRKTRTPAPFDQSPVASGSSSKPPARRARHSVPSPDKESERKPSLKRKRVDDEEDVDSLKRQVRKLQTEKDELQRRYSELERLHEPCHSRKADLDEREQALKTWEQIRSMSVEERATQVLKKIENTFTCPLCVYCILVYYSL